MQKCKKKKKGIGSSSKETFFLNSDFYKNVGAGSKTFQFLQIELIQRVVFHIPDQVLKVFGSSS